MEATLDIASVKKWKRYVEYRPSGAKWHFEVPASWQVRRLKYLADMNPSKAEVSNLPKDTEVSFVPMEQVGEDGTLLLDRSKPIDEVYQGFTYFRNGDVLVAKITPCFENGKGALAKDLKNGIGFGTTEFHVLRPKSEITGRFLELVTRLHPFRGQGISEFTGAAGQQRVPESFLNNYLAPLPSLSEQRAIEEFLERETARIDKLIARKQRLIELLEEKRQAVISHAVTKGLDPKVKMKNSSVEWIGEIPNHWTAPPVASFCTIVRGASPRPAGDPEFFNGSDTPWITVAETTKDNEKYLTETSEHLTAEGRKRSRFLDVDTFVLTNSGATLGVPKILRISGCINDGSVAFLNIDRRISKDFLYYYFTSQTADIRIRMNQGMGQPNLNTNIVSRMPIPCPPQNEQVLIASYLDAACARLKSQVKAIHDSIEYMDEYRTALISAAVTGQIDVREEVKLNG